MTGWPHTSPLFWRQTEKGKTAFFLNLEALECARRHKIMYALISCRFIMLALSFFGVSHSFLYYNKREKRSEERVFC